MNLSYHESMRATIPLFLCFALLAVPVSAVTIPELVSLSKAGVSERVILALIERDQTVFAVDAGRLAELKKDGLTETIILAILRSGRAAPPPPSAVALAPAEPTAPAVIIVGHGPDRPN